MNVSNTREVSFLGCGLSDHLLAVRAGVPRDIALHCAADFLVTTRDLLLVAEEIDSSAVRAAAILLVEAAGAVLNAAD
ncbi:hypothetical protein [Castellaniella sp.]|uniref:hypothetical protein n=1 Tax=Castellaniella sp. TaxID=1955812 RepID=UPI002AFF5BC0|nr:hypothetical protein [Castellaniella sp.]